MVGILELFKKEGKTITVEGNKPLLLADPECIWMIDQGKVAVFTVFLTNGEAVGARDFLFEAEPRDILLGINPEDEEQQLALLAAGISGTRLLQLDMDRYLEACADEEQQEDFINAINSWAGNLAASAAFTEPPRISCSGGIFWADEADEAGSRLDLAGFHRNAVRAVLAQRLNREREEKKRFQARIKNNRRLMEDALGRLLSTMQPAKGFTSDEEYSGDALLDACRLVGHASRIKIVPPQNKKTSSGYTLEEIADASRIRIRKVLLKERWWNQDSGPILAYMEEDGRPVALIPLSANRYEIYDPAGRITLQVDSETARRIKPTAYTFYRPFPHKAMKISDLLVFGRENCRPNDFIMIALMGILGGLLGLAVPVATGIVFDNIIPGGEKAQLLYVALFLTAAAVAAMFFQLARCFAMQRILGKMDGSIQAAVWDRLLSLPAPFFRNYTSGELAMRAMAISEVRMLTNETILTFIFTSIFSSFNIFLIFYYDAKLAGLATGLLAAGIAVNYLMGRLMTKYERQKVDISNRISGMVLQFFGAVAKFRVAGAENRALYQWSGEFSKQKKISFRKQIYSGWLETFNSVFMVASSIIIFYAVVSFTSTKLAPGQFIAFNTAFTIFLMNMISLSQILMGVNSVIPMLERAKPILEALPEYDEEKADPGILSGDIEISHLYFRYEKDSPLVLEDLSLKIKEGEYIGLVGPSGCGKSTLLRVMLGFEKPDSGRVYYSGYDIEKVDIRALRRQLGVVLQNGKLLSGDILTNIVGSNPNLTIKDAWEAAKMAGLDRDIKEMPMGMHTVVSEGAATLSGGQRQRMLIARAIVNRPKIIFFDEATSALDNKTQAIVSESLDGLKATRVIIAHRLSTVINCDRIIVMDKGKIIEEGSYEELMNKKGVFFQLAQRQLA